MPIVTSVPDCLVADTVGTVGTVSEAGEASDARLRIEDGQHDSQVELRMDWEERAAIREFDGGLDRSRAEEAATEDMQAQKRGG